MAVFDADRLVGQTLGRRYRLSRLLRQRDDFYSFEALDILSGKVVVVRIVHAGMPAHGEHYAATILTSVTHPRLVAYSDGQHHSLNVLGSKRLSLVRDKKVTSLKDEVRRRLYSPGGFRLGTVAQDILEGLEALHSHSLAHGDLKPNNVFLQDDGRWQLADYGLDTLDVKSSSPFDDWDVKFVSPELLTGGRGSTASDVFSFAQILLWLAGSDALGANDPHLIHRDAWRWSLRIATSRDPEMRPSASALYDVLFSDGSNAVREALKLIDSKQMYELAHRDYLKRVELVGPSRPNADESGPAIFKAITRLRSDVERHPYISLGLNRIETIARYVSSLSLILPAEPPFHSTWHQMLTDTSERDHLYELGFDLDSDWTESIFSRYQAIGSGDLATSLPEEAMTPEIRAALQPSAADLLVRFKDELKLARRLRSEIMTEEDLLYSDEVAAVLSRYSPLITADEVRNMEQSKLLLAIHDHDRSLFPAFQFNPGTGTVYSAISAVNEVLYRGSGWGVLMWWRRFNRALGAIPQNVLSEEMADEIVRVAKLSLA